MLVGVEIYARDDAFGKSDMLLWTSCIRSHHVNAGCPEGAYPRIQPFAPPKSDMNELRASSGERAQTGNLLPSGYRGCQNLLGLGMPKNRPPPLTNVQISAMFKDLNGTVTNLVLSVAVIHDLLLSKEYVTKSEVSATSERIRAEAKDALAKMHKAHRRAPDQENH
jgi:hypothetical protein